MTWKLRRAWVEDLHNIMELERATFPQDAWSDETMRRELESEHTFYIVAFPEGDPTDLRGYAGMMLPQGATEADIQTVAVAADARRMGLGRLLVRTLVNRARAEGARAVFLEVREDNEAARALYEELGFIEIGTRPGYYQPGNVAAVVMKTVVAGTPSDEAQVDGAGGGSRV